MYPNPPRLGATCPIPETPTRPRSRRSSNWPTISPPAASRRSSSAWAPNMRSSASASPTWPPRPTSRPTASPARFATCSAVSPGSAEARSTDHGNTIGLKQDDAAISLEPAGQFELSGAPVETLHATMAELEAHYDQVRSVSRELQLGWAPLGFHPTATRDADAPDAEGPLCHHAALHAEGGNAGPGHDDANLYRAGESWTMPRNRTW